MLRGLLNRDPAQRVDGSELRRLLVRSVSFSAEGSVSHFYLGVGCFTHGAVLAAGCVADNAVGR